MKRRTNLIIVVLGVLLGTILLWAVVRDTQLRLADETRWITEDPIEDLIESPSPTANSYSSYLTITERSCGELNQLVKTVTNVVPKQIKYTIRIFNNDLNNLLMWRKDSNSPIYRFPGRAGKTVYLYDYPVSNMDNKFRTELIPLLAKSGYSIDDYQVQLKVIDAVWHHYGLSRGEYYYDIDINDSFSDITLNDKGEKIAEISLPENSSSISITCGSAADRQTKSIYDRINSVANYSNDTVISVLNDRDNVIELGVHGLEVGGTTEYWLLRGQTVKKIGEGQDTPFCSMFENVNAGKGYECYDPADEPID